MNSTLSRSASPPHHLPLSRRFTTAFVPDIVGYELESAGADRLVDRICPVCIEVAVDDQRGIVGEIRDDGDIRLGSA